MMSLLGEKMSNNRWPSGFGGPSVVGTENPSEKMIARNLNMGIFHNFPVYRYWMILGFPS